MYNDFYNISLLGLLFVSLLSRAGVATRPPTNNASGNITPAATGSSVSARYQPYTIHPSRLNRS